MSETRSSRAAFRLIILVFAISVAFVAGFVLRGRVMTVDESMFRSDFLDFSVGQDEHTIDQLLTRPEYHLVGVFERTAAQAIWHIHFVAGGPTTITLSVADLLNNNFLNSTGWTYPRHPPHEKMIVIAETKTWCLDFVYLYLFDGKVAAIYVGSS